MILGATVFTFNVPTKFIKEHMTSKYFARQIQMYNTYKLIHILSCVLVIKVIISALKKVKRMTTKIFMLLYFVMEGEY
jgi:uncharacterized membrane protein